jgi:hypothetical protein
MALWAFGLELVLVFVLVLCVTYPSSFVLIERAL